MHSLRDLWSYTLNEGYKIRKSGANGLAGWQPLKSLFAPITVEKFNVSEEHKMLLESCFKLGTDTLELIDSRIECGQLNVSNAVETGHFLVQHFRIPFAEQNMLSLLKLLQIAYNSGQFKAASEVGAYGPEVLDFYATNHLDDISRYADVDRLDEQIRVNLQKGGDNAYKRKYLKYKQKYLEQKKRMGE